MLRAMAAAYALGFADPSCISFVAQLFFSLEGLFYFCSILYMIGDAVIDNANLTNTYQRSSSSSNLAAASAAKSVMSSTATNRPSSALSSAAAAAALRKSPSMSTLGARPASSIAHSTLPPPASTKKPGFIRQMSLTLSSSKSLAKFRSDRENEQKFSVPTSTSKERRVSMSERSLRPSSAQSNRSATAITESSPNPASFGRSMSMTSSTTNKHPRPSERQRRTEIAKISSDTKLRDSVNNSLPPTSYAGSIRSLDSDLNSIAEEPASPSNRNLKPARSALRESSKPASIVSSQDSVSSSKKKNRVSFSDEGSLHQARPHTSLGTVSSNTRTYLYTPKTQVKYVPSKYGLVKVEEDVSEPLPLRAPGSTPHSKRGPARLQPQPSLRNGGSGGLNTTASNVNGKRLSGTSMSRSMSMSSVNPRHSLPASITMPSLKNTLNSTSASSAAAATSVARSNSVRATSNNSSKKTSKEPATAAAALSIGGVRKPLDRVSSDSSVYTDASERPVNLKPIVLPESGLEAKKEVSNPSNQKEADESATDNSVEKNDVSLEEAYATVSAVVSTPSPEPTVAEILASSPEVTEEADLRTNQDEEEVNVAPLNTTEPPVSHLPAPAVEVTSADNESVDLNAESSERLSTDPSQPDTDDSRDMQDINADPQIVQDDEPTLPDIYSKKSEVAKEATKAQIDRQKVRQNIMTLHNVHEVPAGTYYHDGMPEPTDSGALSDESESSFKRLSGKPATQISANRTISPAKPSIKPGNNGDASHKLSSQRTYSITKVNSGRPGSRQSIASSLTSTDMHRTSLDVQVAAYAKALSKHSSMQVTPGLQRTGSDSSFKRERRETITGGFKSLSMRDRGHSSASNRFAGRDNRSDFMVQSGVDHYELSATQSPKSAPFSRLRRLSSSTQDNAPRFISRIQDSDSDDDYVGPDVEYVSAIPSTQQEKPHSSGGITSKLFSTPKTSSYKQHKLSKKQKSQNAVSHNSNAGSLTAEDLQRDAVHMAREFYHTEMGGTPTTYPVKKKKFKGLRKLFGLDT
ncbi:hypothetical protein CANCADRAFT_1478 [Tortispora caseinolytica NRRL Y-17796]|uniref:Uncharacterized protein n=1 Tax=Tortispora caseinolytica NRRL Y-17796 TaxID=767744 RepID=A0A1E4TMB2_9ASCO|nr:hypothetical protein CANCADRAFT_1478 [Tortispora caseinolytica NRRL Y-17796]